MGEPGKLFVVLVNEKNLTILKYQREYGNN